ncbi:hypothetical protein [Acidianus sp. HS-5]|uniref:hypothetical protein n=1 Tax=Acidianus sp. HS-5 TaxID=2886040 RepID=UPI001F1A3B92|nr:hypothetical protein [Acidianus sp. HS-5]BDC18544.1 hypothetical protein HS5_14340 [Acidianus sp. HS-5]
MRLGFKEIDSIIRRDRIVEFYSTEEDLLYLIYHRTLVLSSPIKVVIVSERGGIDPGLVERFEHIFLKKSEIYIRRAFKAEDVNPTIEAMGDGELVILDPFHHKRLYTEIVSSIRKRKGRTFIFSFMDREKEGSIFALHSSHSVIKIAKRGKGGFSFIVMKSVTVDNVEIPYSVWEIFGKSKGGGLMSFILRES